MFFTFYVPGVFKTRWLTNWIQTNECTKISKINNNNVFEKIKNNMTTYVWQSVFELCLYLLKFTNNSLIQKTLFVLDIC